MQLTFRYEQSQLTAVFESGTIVHDNCMVLSCVGSVNADACLNRVHAGLPAVCHNLRSCMRNESMAHVIPVTLSNAAFLRQIPLNSLFLTCVWYVIVKLSTHGRRWPQDSRW